MTWSVVVSDALIVQEKACPLSYLTTNDANRREEIAKSHQNWGDNQT
jgi:hypothetical protein